MPAANTLPFQIIAGVVDIYIGLVGAPFPGIADEYDANTETFGAGTAIWTKLGHTDGGVKVAHPQTIVELRTDQVTAPVKGVRSEEDLQITFSLAEVTLENYAIALNQAVAGPITTTPGEKRVKLYRGGFGVETMAFLARGEHLSPYGDFNLQYEVPSVYQDGSPEVDYTKDAKALLACSMKAIAALAFDPSSDDEDIFGVLRAKSA